MSRPDPTAARRRPRPATGGSATDGPSRAAVRRVGGEAPQRLSTGVLIGVVGVLLLVLLPSTTGQARFALSDAFDEVQLPTVALPGVVTVVVCGLLLLAAAVGFSPAGCRAVATVAGTVAGLPWWSGS